MIRLNFPQYSFKIKRENDSKNFIWDEVRMKFIQLTPEEWVRQHIVKWLVNDMKYPISRLMIEKEIKLNSLKRRPDIVFFNKKGNPEVIVECKAPDIKLTQGVVDQVARYNLVLDAPFLMISNGLESYAFERNAAGDKFLLIHQLPTEAK